MKKGHNLETVEKYISSCQEINAIVISINTLKIMS